MEQGFLQVVYAILQFRNTLAREAALVQSSHHLQKELNHHHANDLKSKNPKRVKISASIPDLILNEKCELIAGSNCIIACFVDGLGNILTEKKIPIPTSPTLCNCIYQVLVYSSYLSKTNAQLVPPNPKLFDMALLNTPSFLFVNMFIPSASSTKSFILADSAMKSLSIISMV